MDPSLHDLVIAPATYVDKILKVARPADLPIEQLVKFDLVINLKTSKVLGLAIPPALLRQAEQVIELTTKLQASALPRGVGGFWWQFRARDTAADAMRRAVGIARSFVPISRQQKTSRLGQ